MGGGKLHRLELQHIAAERQKVGDQLAGASGSDRSKMKQVLAERLQNRPTGLDRGVLATHQHGDDALTRLFGSARDWSVDNAQSDSLGLLAKRHTGRR